MIDVYCTGCLKPIAEHGATFGRCEDGQLHASRMIDSEAVREIRIERARSSTPAEGGESNRRERGSSDAMESHSWQR